MKEQRKDIPKKLGPWIIPVGLVAVALFYCEEIYHYKRTLWGTKELFIVRDLDNHPGCLERNANPRELLCPLPGYNWVRLGCLTEQCTYEDQNAPEITPRRIEDFREMRRSEFGKMPGKMKTWDVQP